MTQVADANVVVKHVGKTAKSRKTWPHSNKYRKRFFKMKEDLLTSGTFIWIHQERFFPGSFVEGLESMPTS